MAVAALSSFKNLATKRLPGIVADDKAGVVGLIERPRRREAADAGHGAR
jgi:hypothetical protein